MTTKYVSNCCGQQMNNFPDDDICPKCKEHCGIEPILVSDKPKPQKMLYKVRRNKVGIFIMYCHECGKDIDGAFWYNSHVRECPHCKTSFIPKGGNNV